MHELSLAHSLVDQVREVLVKEKATRVLELTLLIGALSGVEPEAFEFAFPMATEGTELEQAKLSIERIAATVKCHDCDKESAVELPLVVCGLCSSCNVEIIGGREFMITSMEVE